jgi:hypothetical protein
MSHHVLAAEARAHSCRKAPWLGLVCSTFTRSRAGSLYNFTLGGGFFLPLRWRLPLTAARLPLGETGTNQGESEKWR